MVYVSAWGFRSRGSHSTRLSSGPKEGNQAVTITSAAVVECGFKVRERDQTSSGLSRHSVDGNLEQ